MASKGTRAAALLGFAVGAVAMVVPWARGNCNVYWNRHHCHQGLHEAPVVLNFWNQGHWIGGMSRTSTILMVGAVVLSLIVLWQILMQDGRHEAGRLPALAAGVLYLLAGMAWVDGVGEAGFGIFLILAASGASFIAARGLEQRAEPEPEAAPPA